MHHLMIDLETMGTTPDSPIIAIGACYFDPLSGEIGETFYTGVSLASCTATGAVINADTVLWWLQQSDAARSAFKNNSSHATLHEALNNLSEFIRSRTPSNVQPWGNGATFDVSMLDDSYRRCGIVAPWKFWNVRDVRTVVELAAMKGLNVKDLTRFEGTTHNALDDAKHQAGYVSIACQILLN